MIKKIKIHNTQYDRRVKLTDEQRKEIKHLRETCIGRNGKPISLSKLATMFNVSIRTIHFICHPEKLMVNAEQAKQRQKDGRYRPTKEQAKIINQEHIKYKRQLIKDKKIVI